MTRTHRTFLCALTACAVASAPLRAGSESGLPLRGEISGGVKVTGFPDLGLDWRVEAQGGEILLSARRAGVDVAIEIKPEEGGVWSWMIRRGSLDLAELWPMLRGKLGPVAEAWSASGRLELAGEGAWSAASGPTGRLQLALREGWARSDALKVELGGVELDVETTELAAGVLPARQTLRIGKITAAGSPVGGLRLVFGLDAARVLEVAAGEAELLGGTVRLRPFRVPLEKPAINAAADLDALSLAETARLLPWLIQSAQGRLRGRVEMAWDGEKGLRVRDGGLNIVKSDDAAFRLAPSPGLLTGKMTPRFSVLPWTWARWIGFSNPGYGPLKDIEMGRAGLRIETFEVTFWPDGAGRGRTAAIHIVGRPENRAFVDEVKLDVNFHGPWSEFLAFGINTDFSGFSLRFE